MTKTEIIVLSLIIIFTIVMLFCYVMAFNQLNNGISESGGLGKFIGTFINDIKSQIK